MRGQAWLEPGSSASLTLAADRQVERGEALRVGLRVVERSRLLRPFGCVPHLEVLTGTDDDDLVSQLGVRAQVRKDQDADRVRRDIGRAAEEKPVERAVGGSVVLRFWDLDLSKRKVSSG